MPFAQVNTTGKATVQHKLQIGGGCTFPLPLLSSIACAEIQLREFGGGGGYIFVMKFAAVHSGYKHIFGSGTKLTVRAGKVL